MRVRVMKKKKRSKRPFFIAAALLVIAILLFSGFMHREIIGQNVWALGLPLAGLSKAAACEEVFLRADQIQEGPLEFAAGDRVCRVTSDEMQILLDKSSLEESIEEFVTSKLRFVPASAFKKGPVKVLATPAQYMSTDLNAVLDRVAAELSSTPSGNHYGFDGRELELLPPKEGQTVTREDVLQALEYLPGTRLEVHAETIPALSTASLPALELLSEYSTQYDFDDLDRNYNLMLAAEAVHLQVIEPGQIYSFNKTAGERTEEKGYRYANVVVGDHLEPGLAGGICQVTTTLFDAAVNAGLDFPEIHAHGIPVSYVKPGFDAAVAWNYLDLKIRNNTKSPIVFGAWVEDGEMAVRVFGEPGSSTYELETVVVKEFPEEGKNPGLLVETYQVEKSGGQTVGRTLLVRSLYLASYPHPK